MICPIPLGKVDKPDSMIIPMHWVGGVGVVTVFIVMFALGLMLSRQQIHAALERRVVLAAVTFAVLVPIPALAVLVVEVFQPPRAVAAGIVLMAISPGAPVALRRALDAGGDPHLAPALHLSIVLLAVVTVPASVVILDWIFNAHFTVTPLDIGRQVFFAQLLPLALGAGLRAFRPHLAHRIEPQLAKAGNVMLLLLGVMALIDAPPIFALVGWLPTAAGVGMTAAALAVGMIFAGRHHDVRPAAGVIAAMRNPGLALLIATLNHAPPQVTSSVIGYAFGLAVTIIGFLKWQTRWTRRGKTG